MSEPSDAAIKLVQRVADALSEYHQEKPGGPAAYMQAAELLTMRKVGGPLQGRYNATDFLIDRVGRKA